MSDIENKGVKEEPNDSDEDDDEPQTLGPAVFGLHRVGTKPPKRQCTQPKQVLNARGMPARIRKKNKLFFDDDIVNDVKAFGSSPRKGANTTGSGKSPGNPSPTKSSSTPTKILKKRKGIVSKYMRTSTKDGGSNSTSKSTSPAPSTSTSNVATTSKTTTKSLSSANTNKSLNISSPLSSQKPHNSTEKKSGQVIGLRLRNLLKLPKAHKWVSFEWFYSYIDRPLFDGPNDFQNYLRDEFPQLKTRMLTRKEWSKIRSMLGKPRRCSQAFFNQERRELEHRRQKIRFLQNRKTTNVKLNYIKDLPNEIPLPLPVGTKVTARLRQPQDGIFTGNVDAVDSVSSKYRISFDRPGLGSHTVPDFEIMAIDFNETIPLSSLVTNFRPRLGLNGNLLSSSSPSKVRNALNKSDPLLGQDLYQNQFKNPVMARDTIGGYPIRFLEMIVRAKKALALKHIKVERLKDLNIEAEVSKTHGDILTEDFQRRYANLVMHLHKINRDLKNYLEQLNMFSNSIIKESTTKAMIMPSYLREKCREKAEEMVHRNNHGHVEDEKILNLITNLATILMVASNLSSSSPANNAQTLKILDGCNEEVKQHLHPENVEIFQKSVQIHLHHIRLGIAKMADNFKSNDTNDVKVENDKDSDSTSSDEENTYKNNDHSYYGIKSEDNDNKNTDAEIQENDQDHNDGDVNDDDGDDDDDAIDIEEMLIDDDDDDEN